MPNKGQITFYGIRAQKRLDITKRFNIFLYLESIQSFNNSDTIISRWRRVYQLSISFHVLLPMRCQPMCYTSNFLDCFVIAQDPILIGDFLHFLNIRNSHVGNFVKVLLIHIHKMWQYPKNNFLIKCDFPYPQPILTRWLFLIYFLL